MKVSLDALRKIETDLQKEVERTILDISAKPIVRFVAQGLERDPQFGGDQQSFGVRVSKSLPDIATGGSNLDFQLDYLDNEMPNGVDALEGWKLGAKYSTMLLRNTSVLKGKGVLLTAAGAVEKYSDVVAPMHDSIAKLGLVLSFKIGDAVHVPLSITWANRTDLLGDEDDVIGHVGFSIDYDALLKLR